MNYRELEPIIEDVLRQYGIDPYEPAIHTENSHQVRHRTMLPQDIAKSVGRKLEEHLTQGEQKKGDEE